MSAEPDLRLAESHAVDGALHTDPNPLAAARGGALRVVVRARDLTWSLLSLATDARRLAPDVKVQLDLPLSLVACGDFWLIAGSSGEEWKLIAFDDAGRLVHDWTTPSWTVPLCVAGHPAAVLWADQGARVAVTHPRDAFGEPTWVALCNTTQMEGVAALRDGVAVVRAGAFDRPVEIIDVSDGKIRARTRIAGTEGAVAPSLAAAGDRLFSLWAMPGRLMLQAFDAALRPDGAPIELTTLRVPHSFDRSFAAARSDGRLVVGYVDRERTGVVRAARGAPVTYRKSTWAAVYNPTSGSVGTFHAVDEHSEAPCLWVGDRLVVLTPAIGALRMNLWEA